MINRRDTTHKCRSFHNNILDMIIIMAKASMQHTHYIVDSNNIAVVEDDDCGNEEILKHKPKHKPFLLGVCVVW